MKNLVDVSIVAANYNNGKFLDRFINSIISSTVLPVSVIIVNDGSTDNSVEILLKLKEKLPQLEIVDLGTNKGFANALNEGINIVKTKYIARVDPDDALHENRLEKQFLFLEKNNHIAVVGTNARIFDSFTGETVNYTNFPENPNKVRDRYLSGEHGILHPTVMGRSEFFEKYKYRQEWVPAEDYDIFARMIRDGLVIANLPQALTHYRVHANSVSNNLPKSTIMKTYQLRDEIFGTKTSPRQIHNYYMYIKYYRKFLYERNKLRKFSYGLLASIFYPQRFFGKFISLTKSR